MLERYSVRISQLISLQLDWFLFFLKPIDGRDAASVAGFPLAGSAEVFILWLIVIILQKYACKINEKSLFKARPLSVVTT